jgi:hypothetical protein
MTTNQHLNKQEALIMRNQIVSREEWLRARLAPLEAEKEFTRPVAPGVAGWLSLAAAPTFAIMALLTAVHGPPDMLCSTTQDASPFSGMVPMYLLMSAFHAAPWLKLITSRRSSMTSPT